MSSNLSLNSEPSPDKGPSANQGGRSGKGSQMELVAMVTGSRNVASKDGKQKYRVHTACEVDGTLQMFLEFFEPSKGPVLKPGDRVALSVRTIEVDYGVVKVRGDVRSLPPALSPK